MRYGGRARNPIELIKSIVCLELNKCRVFIQYLQFKKLCRQLPNNSRDLNKLESLSFNSFQFSNGHLINKLLVLVYILVFYDIFDQHPVARMKFKNKLFNSLP